MSEFRKLGSTLEEKPECVNKTVSAMKLAPMQKALVNSLVLLLMSAPAFAFDGTAYSELYAKLPQLRGASGTTEIKKILTDNYASIPKGVLALVGTTRSSTFRNQLNAFSRDMGGAPASAALMQCSSDPGSEPDQLRNGSMDYRVKLSSDFAKSAAALMQCSSDPGGGDRHPENLASDFAKSATALMQCSSDPGGDSVQRQKSTVEYREDLLSKFTKEAAALMANDPGGVEYVKSAEALMQCSSDPGGGEDMKSAEALMQCSSDPGGGDRRLENLTSDFAKAATALMQCSSEPGSRSRLESNFARAGLALLSGEKGGANI
jgi:hypothetical protein